MLSFILLSILTFALAIDKRNVWTYVRWGGYVSLLLAAAVSLWGVWAPAVTSELIFKISVTIVTLLTTATGLLAHTAATNERRSIGDIVITNVTSFPVPQLTKRAAQLITNATYVLHNITGVSYSLNSSSANSLMTTHYHPYTDTMRSGIVGSAGQHTLDELYDRLIWDYTNQDVDDLTRALYWGGQQANSTVVKRGQQYYSVDWWSYNYAQDVSDGVRYVEDMTSGIDQNQAIAGFQEVLGQGPVNKYCLAFTGSEQSGYNGIYDNLVQGELYFNRYGGIDGPCEDYKDGADCQVEGCGDPQ